MKLALGTVQFGLAYGVAGPGHAVAEGEVSAILALAWERGVEWLDTAPAYGDIEERLRRLADGRPFRVVSKVPALPAELDDAAAARWAVASARRSHERLGDGLCALLAHRADDLRGERGAAVWQALADWAGGAGVTLGASCYDPVTANALRRERGIAAAQLPGSALDQRLSRDLEPGLDVHLRSAFLQGLLLMPPERAAARVPAAAGALQRWQRWLLARALTPLHGALGVVKSFAAVQACVVGVDSLRQWREIVDAWDAVEPLEAGELACDDPEVIDPRQWRTA